MAPRSNIKLMVIRLRMRPLSRGNISNRVSIHLHCSGVCEAALEITSVSALANWQFCHLHQLISHICQNNQR